MGPFFLMSPFLLGGSRCNKQEKEAELLKHDTHDKVQKGGQYDFLKSATTVLDRQAVYREHATKIGSVTILARHFFFYAQERLSCHS